MIYGLILSFIAFIIVELVFGKKRDEYIEEKNPKGNFLIFDVETNGLPKNYHASVSNSSNWPEIVQIAWVLIDPKGGIIEEKDFIVKPEGFTIKPESTSIHGISNEIAIMRGESRDYVLKEFNKVANQAKFIVAHNLEFDNNVLEAEFIRANVSYNFTNLSGICTMKKGTNFCAIKTKRGYKWPTLQELHSKLFNSNFRGEHNAKIDVNICLKCFKEMYNRRIIEV